MNISKEYKKIDNIKVLTDIGFIPINYVIKTIKFKKFIILFESGNMIECADKHAFIDISNKEIMANELLIGDLIKTDYGDGIDEIFDIFETDEYEEMYDLNLNEYHKYYTNGILSHNSNFLANVAARQVLNGHNVVLMTLEMAEDAFAQRFDSIFSLLDINRMYIIEEMKSTLVRKLKELKEKEDRGNLFIKQFPTGDASVKDFKIYLRELTIRDIKPSILYVDYINLMKSAYKTEKNMYSVIKRIAEELRSLSFEFKVPVVSVSQLNREGSFVNFNELDFTYIAESLGLPATADFMSIMGTNDDSMVYQNEVLYKIVKNRLGGRVGDFGRFYYDSRNLKMYDSTELDQWIADAEISRDERTIHQTERRNTNENGNRQRRR